MFGKVAEEVRVHLSDDAVDVDFDARERRRPFVLAGRGASRLRSPVGPEEGEKDEEETGEPVSVSHALRSGRQFVYDGGAAAGRRELPGIRGTGRDDNANIAESL
jgi:hypothetical protein